MVWQPPVLSHVLLTVSQEMGSPKNWELECGNLWVWVMIKSCVNLLTWLLIKVVHSCAANQDRQLSCRHNSWQWLQLINFHPCPPPSSSPLVRLACPLPATAVWRPADTETIEQSVELVSCPGLWLFVHFHAIPIKSQVGFWLVVSSHGIPIRSRVGSDIRQCRIIRQ